VTVPATGELTVHGTKKTVTTDVTAKRSGGTIQVNGTIPVVFADYGIPNPSFGPAQTRTTARSSSSSPSPSRTTRSGQQPADCRHSSTKERAPPVSARAASGATVDAGWVQPGSRNSRRR